MKFVWVYQYARDTGKGLESAVDPTRKTAAVQ